MSDAITSARRTERFDLQALYETSCLLSTSLDLEFVLNNLLLSAMSKLLVSRGVAMLWEPEGDGGCYTVATVKGLSHLPVGTRLDLGSWIDKTVREPSGVPAVLAEHGIVRLMPVSFGDRRIGLIGLGKKMTGAPFEEEEHAFIESLVNMSSAAINNSIMVEDLRAANRSLDGKIQQLNTLFELSKGFNATVDRKRLVKLLSFALMGQMMVNKHLLLMGGSVGSQDGEHPYRVISSHGLGSDPLEPQLIDTLCGLEDQVILNNREEVDEAWEGFARRGLVLALPIQHQGENCGMLCLGAKMTGQPYSPDDIEMLRALSNLAFVSIQNSFLVEEQIEKERLEQEMRLAREIQEGLQPRDLPDAENLEFAAVALASRHVAGDYFDILALDEHRLLFVIADVTGKGLPASLLMSNLQACIHVMAPMQISIEEAVAHANRVICGNTGYDKFITCFAGIYHSSDRTFQYVNAGHNPPTLVRASGEIELLETGGLILGVMQGMPYERGIVEFHPGDVLAMFTDGVTEAMSPEGEEFEEKRLEPLLVEHRSDSAAEILETVKEALRVFTHDAITKADDLTMIVLKAH